MEGASLRIPYTIAPPVQGQPSDRQQVTVRDTHEGIRVSLSKVLFLVYILLFGNLMYRKNSFVLILGYL